FAGQINCLYGKLVPVQDVHPFGRFAERINCLYGKLVPIILMLVSLHFKKFFVFQEKSISQTHSKGNMM
ncbi:hypothetical protein PJI17_32690, partial [Mycobacterium kansasii]